jgi:hypothetical protein
MSVRRALFQATKAASAVAIVMLMFGVYNYKFSAELSHIPPQFYAVRVIELTLLIGVATFVLEVFKRD